MAAGAPKENKNAEKWTIEEATNLFQNAIDLSKETEIYIVGSGQNKEKVSGYKYHFLGEIASDLDQYPDLFKYLRKKSEELDELYNRIKGRLESNCFSDSKKGIIKEATAIMNLKSNYKWTDRLDNTTKGEKITTVTREIID